MNLLDLLWKIKHAAQEFLSLIFNYDYSALEKEFLGLSLLDILGFVLCMYMLLEILKWFVNLLGSFLQNVTNLGLSFLFNFLMVLGRRVFYRCYYTIEYIWSLDAVIRWRGKVQLNARRKLYAAIPALKKP